MSEPSYFDLKIVADDEPLRNDPFYAYLNENTSKGDEASRLDHIKGYLVSLGFVPQQDCLMERDLKTLEYVYDVWQETTPWSHPMTKAELFCEGQEFWVQGLDGKTGGRAGIMPALRETVEKSGWIYPVVPDTTYFQIIEDRVYARYQQILGSRFICRIKE